MSKFQVGDRVVVTKAARWDGNSRYNFGHDLIGTVADDKDGDGDYYIELDEKVYDNRLRDYLEYLYAHEDSLRPLTETPKTDAGTPETPGVWVHANNGPTGSGEVTVYVEEIDALRAYAAEGVGKVVFVPYGETLYL